MHLTILGSSGSYSVPGRPASGYLIEQGTTRVWCDAGPGTFPALVDILDPELLSAVVLSHQHIDHCIDVLAGFHTWAFGPTRTTGISLLAPQALLDRLISFLDPDPSHPFYQVFTLDPVGDGDQRQIGELAVTFAITDHSVPTVASRWDSGARTLAYTADTGPEGDWRRLATDVDLFLCEATYQGGREDVVYPHHLTAAEAGRIAREVDARQLMLTHIPPHLDPVRSVEEAEAVYGRPVDMAVPGARHKV